jgi:tRNA-uridine 2-sulfurtransferase
MLPELAEKEGIAFDHFATGHYARVEWHEGSGRYRLLKGADPAKDQSYFIFRLDQSQLSRILLPLGGMTKSEVRKHAERINIPLSDKEESQDFYSGDYKELINAEENPGDIVNLQGKVLGLHKGIWNYTIGQRKGLGVAWTEPLYVIGLDAAGNKVIVGTREEGMSTSFLVNDLNWISIPALEERMDVMAKIRSAQREIEASVEPAGNGTVRVTLMHPGDGIAPGQSAVFCDGEIVIGGGTILEAAK